MKYFLLLYFIHLLADYSLQPLSWIKDRDQRKAASTGLLKHVLVHTLITALALWKLELWWVWLTIAITHWSCDVWKAHQASNLKSYLIDQAFHASVIFILSIILSRSHPGGPLLFEWLPGELTGQVLAVGCGIMLMLRPSSMILMYFMKGFILDPPDTYALENAGKWIGYFERLIILMCILIGAYTVLGFLVAAKSLLRFGDKNHDRKHTEYVLIGSLLSWGIGIGVALACRFVINHL